MYERMYVCTYVRLYVCMYLCLENAGAYEQSWKFCVCGYYEFLVCHTLALIMLALLSLALVAFAPMTLALLLLALTALTLARLALMASALMALAPMTLALTIINRSTTYYSNYAFQTISLYLYIATHINSHDAQMMTRNRSNLARETVTKFDYYNIYFNDLYLRVLINLIIYIKANEATKRFIFISN